MPDGNALGRFKAAARARGPNSDHALQAGLAQWNRARLALQTPDHDLCAALARDEEMRRVELDFIETSRAAQSARARDAPRQAGAFVAWFEALKESGPGQGDALFPWLW